MVWYHNLLPNSINSFAMLTNSFIKAHVEAIKVETRKSDLFKVRQKDNEMIREFISRFQMERIDLQPVTDDWDVQAFTQGLNEQSSMASRQLKKNLIEYPAVTWADIHNQYQSKIRVDDDQLDSGSVIKRDIDREPRSTKDRYQPYNRDRRGSECIKDTKWPRPLQSNPDQRNPNQMCKYLGTHGHRTQDCMQLRVKVARLFNERNHREFLSDRAKNHFKNRDFKRQNE
ncbi:uncharacterized protein [Nicotiana tomentosiformis]|uniref:uncharacterized protein n=1 Tax=Nicotiana tomentosiformis TaxID=4098 RepID=UPI00388C5EF7